MRSVPVGLRLAIAGVVAGISWAVVAGAADQPRPLPKNNSACLVCHINFETEPIAARHLKQGITCARCHGISYDHMNDEEAAAKPDVLFGRAEVDPYCRSCHRAHKNPAAVAKFMAEWEGKRRPQGRLILPDATCTDCHGLHRLPRGGGHTELKP